MRTGEARGLLRSYKGRIVRGATVRTRLAPPPASAQPLARIAITHLLHPDTPANPDELTSDIERHNAEVRSFVLLAPLGDAAAALDEAVPPDSEARRLLGEVALTAPELGELALRIADYLDGLARLGKVGPVPMAGIVLHSVLGELLRQPEDDPWDRAVTVYRGMWKAVGYYLVDVRIETPVGGIWTSSRPVLVLEVLAGQERCTISRPEEGDGTYGHACLDWPISEELARRWRR